MNFTYGVICDHITALLIIYKLPDARSSGLHVESNAFIPVLGILSPLGTKIRLFQLWFPVGENASMYFVTLRRVFYVNTKKHSDLAMIRPYILRGTNFWLPFKMLYQQQTVPTTITPPPPDLGEKRADINSLTHFVIPWWLSQKKKKNEWY